jgi:TRAP-type C4-dicarboxylate transport system permease small subunit
MDRLIHALPRIVLGGLVLFAIGVMLCGVFLRYVMLPITDWMDVDPINFFWVEEVGELTLTWLTMIGAAVGVAERSHFTLNIFVHRLPPAGQHAMHVVNHLLIASFGGLIAWICFKLAMLNASLTSPALEISLGLFYVSATVGGILMVLYALNAARQPAGLETSFPEHSLADVRE